MKNDTDIHQLDSDRQVLFVLNEADSYLSIQEISKKLLEYKISTSTKSMQSFLNTLRDRRLRFLKNGLIHKDGGRYRVMQKGIEYLKSTVVVINPSSEKSIQETVGHILHTLSGDIKLCDPYFDGATYDLLKSHLCPSRIKSIRVIHNNNRNSSVNSYKIGKHSIKLKRKKGLHDRFMIDDSRLYCFGTSLNHIGNKLSFIFNLTIYRDTFDGVFQDCWDSSQE